MNALAERLTAARKAAKVTQDAAAVHLRMSRPTLIAIEKGTRPVKPAELVALAALYQTTVHKLMRQDAPPLAIAPHLRAAVGDEEQDSGIDEAIAKLSEFVDDYRFLLDKTGSAMTPAPPPQPARTHRSVEKFAEHCAHDQRKLLGLGDREPIGSLRETLDQTGVQIFVDNLNQRLAGLYSFVNGFGYCILVNRQHRRVRRRWTIAHEFGHFLFDRDRPGVDYTQAMRRKPESERFADAFAAHFLMPRSGVERRFHDIYDQKGDVNVGDVVGMADHYGVSLMAMVIRLETLSLIKRGSWEAIESTGARIKDIRAESDLPEVQEKHSVDIFPERYRLLAVQAWNSEAITTSQLAKLLRKPVVDAREFAMSISEDVAETDHGRLTISLSLGNSLVRGEHSPA